MSAVKAGGASRFFKDKTALAVPRWGMGSESKPDQFAAYLTEEILRLIFGDDYKGCTVSPEQVTALIQENLARERARAEELLDLYEKVVEAVNLLSTPPDPAKVREPQVLTELLTERLDGIHSVTVKTMATTAKVRPPKPSTGE